jgi:hypothetical protein
MPKYRSKDKTVEISGAGPNGEAIGPISFKSGTYSTDDELEAFVLDPVAIDETTPISFDQKEE